MDREKVITGLELCTNISPDGCLMLCPYKDEKDETFSGFCEQVLKQDALSLLKEQQEEIENLKQTCQSMMEGVCMIKKKDECVENLEHQYGCFELKSETAIYFTEDQFDLILKWMESTGSETIQDAIIQAIYRASIQGKLSLFNEQPTHNQCKEMKR